MNSLTLRAPHRTPHLNPNPTLNPTRFLLPPADFRECSLEVGGRCVLRFAAAYGFRNVQGLMRKVKAGRGEYDYVEIMACPSGCLNGGGQLPPSAGSRGSPSGEGGGAGQDALPAGALLQSMGVGGREKETPAQLLERVEAAYHWSAAMLPAWPPGGAVAAAYDGWVGGVPGGRAARALLHTQYHRREKTAAAAVGDW